MTAFSTDIRRAALILESGGLVAFPTETVYGLGADAENPAAVASIYAAKGRPSNHPVIVHLAPEADIAYWVTSIPAEAQALMQAFWPGPLTLILKRAAHIPDAVSGGQDTIGLRCPSHPVAQALLRAFKGGKGGLAAPSANKFGHVSPTTAQHVLDEFSAEFGNTFDSKFGNEALIGAILDGGQSAVGIESTILDLSRLDAHGPAHGPVLLRPGHISAAQIAAVIGAMPGLPDQAAPRASGTLAAHYAPRTAVALIGSASLEATVQRLHRAGRRVALIRHSVHSAGPIAQASGECALPANPDGYAHGLYAALRAMDAIGADLILIESPPQASAWLGINDRLRRAAHDSSGILQRLL